MSWLITLGGQSIGASASISVLQLQHQSFKENPGFISSRTGWFDLLATQGNLNSLLQHTIRKNQFFSTQASYGPVLTSVHEKLYF